MERSPDGPLGFKPRQAVEGCCEDSCTRTASPRRLVVLQVLPSLEVGGVERGVVEVAAHLCAHGIESYVASAGGAQAEQLVRGAHVDLPQLCSKNPLNVLVVAPLSLRRVIRERGVTLVHARSRVSAWSCWLATRGTPACLVTTHHGVYGLDRAWKRAVARVMLWGEGIILPSQFMLDFVCRHQRLRLDFSETTPRTPPSASRPSRLLPSASPLPRRLAALLSLLGIPPPHRLFAATARGPLACVIPRGVDVGAFSADAVSAAAASALAHQWGLCPDASHVVFCGRVSKNKGVADFVRAMRLLLLDPLYEDIRPAVCGLIVGAPNAADNRAGRGGQHWCAMEERVRVCVCARVCVRRCVCSGVCTTGVR